VSENASKTTAYRGTRILIPHANEAPRALDLFSLPSPPPPLSSASPNSAVWNFAVPCPMLREMGVKRVGEEVAESFRLDGGEGANFPENGRFS